MTTKNKQLTEIQQNMVTDNINLVYFVVRKYWGNFSSHMQEDLIQEGYIGLINAVLTYNEDIAKFSTYAVKCIKYHLFKYCERKVYKYADILSLDYTYENYGNEDIVTLSDMIEDKNNGVENFIDKYSAEQELKYVLRFTNQDDYNFIVKHYKKKDNERYTRKKYGKEHSKCYKIINKARHFNKAYKKLDYIK